MSYQDDLEDSRNDRHTELNQLSAMERINTIRRIKALPPKAFGFISDEWSFEMRQIVWERFIMGDLHQIDLDLLELEYEAPK